MTEMSAAEAAVVARFEAGEPAPESWGGHQGCGQPWRLCTCCDLCDQPRHLCDCPEDDE